MAKQPAKKRNRAAQDTTLINLRALKKHMDAQINDIWKYLAGQRPLKRVKG